MMPPFLLSATLNKIGTLSVRYESDVVRARNLASMLAQEMRFDKTSGIKTGTAVSELCRNMLEHAKGGTVDFYLSHKAHQDGIVIIFTDYGPGIRQLDAIRNGTFKSVHGMGVGLAGSQRLMDDFDIQTTPGKGTVITAARWLSEKYESLSETSIGMIQSAFSKMIERGDSSLVETINAQNKELMILLKNLQERNEEIETINKELEETNKGVLALNRELEDKAIAIEKAKHLAEQANRAKSDFLAHMSHEIRTPMNAILGFADLLLKTNLSNMQKQYTDNVNVAGKALLGIINDILDFSKIEAGKLELEMLESDIFDLLSQTIEIFKYTTAKKGLELLLTISPQTPRFMTTDPVRLKQILINLLSNAIKFTEAGEIELKVDFKEENDEKGQFRFSVSDTGIGIKEEQKQRLFKAFSQADASTTRQYGGTGLGLVISNLLAAKMNSTLMLESEWGKGSTFHFEICSTFRRKPLGNEVPCYKYVLLMDSNPKVLDNYAKWFAFWNIRVDLFYNVFDADRALRARNYDLIVGRNKMQDIPESVLADRVRSILNNMPVPPAIIVLHNSHEEEYGNLYASANIRLSHIMMPAGIDELWFELCQKSTGDDVLLPENELTKTEQKVASGIRKKILIAEDVKMNMVLIKVLVKNIFPDAELIEAENGQVALDIIKAHDVDMVLMDVQMPVLDGIEATRRIRLLQNTAVKDVPVVALTAGALQEEREKALLAGMNDFLSKPIDGDKLKSVLYKYLLLS